MTLSSVGVTDPMPGLSPLNCPEPVLSPSAQETCTADYTTTQADVDAGGLTNTGTASGTPPTGPAVTAQDTMTVPAQQTSGMTLVKSAGITSYSAAGTVVPYSYLVTNTGNVTLSSVTVTDPMAGLTPVSCPESVLEPGNAETCSASYVTTQADVDAGSITNTGTATAHPPIGPALSADDTVVVPAVQTPAIGIVKTADVDSFAAAGLSVTYSYDVTNSGNVTLDPVVVSDPMPGLSPISCPDTSLLPGTQETCTATYTTTQADVDAGSINNTGTATGTPPARRPRSVTSPR